MTVEIDPPDHPPEPQGANDVRYRGWIAGYSWQREYFTGRGYTAVNAEDATNCTILAAETWLGLLEQIDDFEAFP
jgi:hypothetical protein